MPDLAVLYHTMRVRPVKDRWKLKDLSFKKGPTTDWQSGAPSASKEPPEEIPSGAPAKNTCMGGGRRDSLKSLRNEPEIEATRRCPGGVLYPPILPLHPVEEAPQPVRPALLGAQDGEGASAVRDDVGVGAGANGQRAPLREEVLQDHIPVLRVYHYHLQLYGRPPHAGAAEDGRSSVDRQENPGLGVWVTVGVARGGQVAPEGRRGRILSYIQLHKVLQQYKHSATTTTKQQPQQQEQKQQQQQQKTQH